MLVESKRNCNMEAGRPTIQIDRLAKSIIVPPTISDFQRDSVAGADNLIFANADGNSHSQLTYNRIVSKSPFKSFIKLSAAQSILKTLINVQNVAVCAIGARM